MKIEFEYPEDELVLKVLYSPAMIDPPSRWLVYCTSVKVPHYYGVNGIGPTPQAAIDDAVRQVREYLVRAPQGWYTPNVPNIDLDLTGLLKDI